MTGRRYRQLAWSTVGLTFLLVVIGGVVRVSDSGLGCGPAGSGLKGWPLCHGRLIPGVDINHIIEYSHRAVASTLGLLVISLVVWALRRYRGQRAVWRLALAALALILFEGGLGGATVENDLHELLVAVHLGTAMLIIATLLALARVSSGLTEPLSWPVGIKRLATAAAAGVWATIVAGGYMAGTQNYGRTSYEAGDGAHMACGREFPTCNGSFLPFGDARLVDIHLIHRSLVYVTVALVIALAISVIRHPGSRDSGAGSWGFVLIGIVCGQVLLGGMNVWLGEQQELIAAHLAVGTLLWLATVWLTLCISGRPHRIESLADARPANSGP